MAKATTSTTVSFRPTAGCNQGVLIKRTHGRIRDQVEIRAIDKRGTPSQSGPTIPIDGLEGLAHALIATQATIKTGRVHESGYPRIVVVDGSSRLPLDIGKLTPGGRQSLRNQARLLVEELDGLDESLDDARE